MTNLPRDTEHALAALADGSLAPGRREQVLERVRGSRELQDALAEQQRALELTAAVDVRAPASVHSQVEAMLKPARRRRVSWAPHVGFAAAAALAVAAVAIGLIGQSGPTRLSVRQAAALTLSPATMPAPAEDRTNRAQLAAAVGGVPFPYWEEHFGWRSSGARTDQIAGRSVTTVFYSNAEGRRIGYAIASGRAPSAEGGTVVKRWGVPYRVLNQDGATVVTWQRAGHLCVISGRGVGTHTLLDLASWSSEQPHTA
jgi:hypothetical protein